LQGPDFQHNRCRIFDFDFDIYYRLFGLSHPQAALEAATRIFHRPQTSLRVAPGWARILDLLFPIDDLRLRVEIAALGFASLAMTT